MRKHDVFHNEKASKDLPLNLRPVSMRFEDFDFDPSGIIDFFWPRNRMNVARVRDAMLDELKVIHTSLPMTNFSARLSIELLGLMWTISLCRIAHAQGLVDDFSVAGKWLVNTADFPLVADLQAQRRPVDEGYVNELLGGEIRHARWRWPLRVARQALQQPIIPMMHRQLVNFQKSTVATSVGGLIDRRASMSKRPVVHCDATQWFGPVSLGEDEDVLLGVLDSIVVGARKAARQIGVVLNDSAEVWFRRQVMRSSAAAVQQWCHLTDGRIPIPSRLWVGTMSRSWPRLLARATMEMGGEVEAHDHGSGSGRFVATGSTYLIKGFCHRFFTFGSGQKRVMQSNFDLHGFATSTRPICEEIGDCERISMSYKNKSSDFVTKNPSVLIEPFVCERESLHSVPVPDDLVVADFNARLAGVLASSGFKVRFKPHPGHHWGFLARERLKDRLGVDVVSGQFEEAAAASDIILFCHPFTSTLGATIKQNKPIVLLNRDDWHWDSSAFKELSKRCAIIDLVEDDDHRLQCDWNELLSAIRTSYFLKDPSFEQQFLSGSDF
jgi:hypothetical protein